MWVPCFLTPEQKRAKCTVSKENLELFEADETIFLLVSSLWIKPGFITTSPKPKNSPSNESTRHLQPKKAKVVSSADRVGATTFDRNDT